MEGFEDSSNRHIEIADVDNSKILELIEPTKRILESIHSHIDNGDYKLVVGGDASGRIPALIFTKIIREVYKKRGFEMPKTLTTFIAGGVRNTTQQTNEKIEEIKNHLRTHYVPNNITPEPSEVDQIKLLIERDDMEIDHIGRILIVDDTLYTGESIRPVTDSLKEMGIEFDIASIGMIGVPSVLKEVVGDNIYYGAVGVPSIYSNRSLSGVSKNRGDLFSKPIKYTDLDGVLNRESVVNARKDIDAVAKHLIKWYLDKFK